MIQKRLDLAGKQQRAVGAAAVVERLYAEHIPGAEKHLRPAVPQRKGEHSPQPGEQLAAPLLPPVQQHLGVGAGGKGVAQGCQLGGQFAIVVDFAVEHDDEIFILAVQRLCAALCVTAVAAGPSLWQYMQARQGPFAGLAQTVEGAVCTSGGIEIRVLSALADDVRGEVYFTVRDVEGDRLDSQLTLRCGADSDLAGRLVEYDPESRTALFAAGMSYYRPQTEGSVGLSTTGGTVLDTLHLAVERLTTRQGELDAGASCAGVTAALLDSLPLGEGDRVVMGVEESGYPASILPGERVVLAPGQTPMPLEGTGDVTISSMGFASDGRFHVRVAYAPGIGHGDLDMGYFLARVYPRDERRTAEEKYWRATVITQVEGGLDVLFPLIKAGEEAELGEVYFYGGYERPGVDIAGPWSIDFPLEHYPSAVLEWTGTLAGRRVDHVTVSPLTVTMDSDDTGGFSTAELTVVLKDGTEVPAACGPGRYANVGEGAGVEVWDAYNTWELERPVEVAEIDHLLLLGEHIPVS